MSYFQESSLTPGERSVYPAQSGVLTLMRTGSEPRQHTKQWCFKGFKATGRFRPDGVFLNTWVEILFHNHCLGSSPFSHHYWVLGHPPNNKASLMPVLNTWKVAIQFICFIIAINSVIMFLCILSTLLTQFFLNSEQIHISLCLQHVWSSMNNRYWTFSIKPVLF